MSIFHHITEDFEKKAVNAAVQHLGSQGMASLPGIGSLFYDYQTNKLSIEPSDTILDRVRKEWEKNHGNST